MVSFDCQHMKLTVNDVAFFVFFLSCIMVSFDCQHMKLTVNDVAFFVCFLS